MRDFWDNLCFYGRCLKIVCRDLWKRVFPVEALLCVCGCVNLYTRFPTTEERIESVYQCSLEAAGLSVLVAFPQAMSDVPKNQGFKAWNLFTIPLGCLFLCDTAAEACVDTICFPADYFLAGSRKEHE